MTRKLSIRIFNASLVRENFYIFLGKPSHDSPTESTPQPYFLGNPVNPGGELIFKFLDNLYAVAGLVKATPDAHASIAQWDHSKEPVTLGSAEHPGSYFSVTVDKDEGIITLGDDLKKDSFAGDFSFQTKADFSQENDKKYYLGIGMENNLGEIAPVSVFTATPSAEFHVYPQLKFYLTVASKIEKGILFDLETTGKTIEIDFSDLNKTSASVTYLQDGTFTVNIM